MNATAELRLPLSNIKKTIIADCFRIFDKNSMVHFMHVTNSTGKANPMAELVRPGRTMWWQAMTTPRARVLQVGSRASG
jgi:hypothetical protein